jgi:hypothetical protein
LVASDVTLRGNVAGLRENAIFPPHSLAHLVHYRAPLTDVTRIYRRRLSYSREDFQPEAASLANRYQNIAECQLDGER